MIDLKLDGKVAIVTGAGRGLGRSAAAALAEQGVRVLGVSRSMDELRSLEEESTGVVRTSVCDMRDLDAVVALPQLALDVFGRLDIVVNNAGIAPAGPFVDQPFETWHDVMAVNATAPAALLRAAGPILLAQRAGKVINVASTSGILGKPLLVAYSSSKGALLQFTKALAAEWASAGVQVNAIAPGAFETTAQQAVLDSPEMLERRLRKIPARRMADPNELGPLVCWLSSSLSDFVTGSVIVIDGGESSKL